MLAGAAAPARGATTSSELRRSLEERLATPVETVDPRAAAALTDRIVAAPALLDTLAPLVGLLLRDARGRRRDPHQSLDAAVLQRARRRTCWLLAIALIVVGGDRVQRLARHPLLAQRHASSPRRPRATRRAPPICARRRPGCARPSIRSRSSPRRRTRARPTT